MALTESWLVTKTTRRHKLEEGSTFLSSFELDNSDPFRAGQLRLTTLVNASGLCFMFCSVETSTGVFEWKKVVLTSEVQVPEDFLPYGSINP